MIFTSEQEQVFRFISTGSGHGIIDAVAGAGKTTTLMECARLVKQKGSILFCAFNTSIANEISRRFDRLDLTTVNVRTIHALGRQLLQEHNHTGRPLKLQPYKYNELLQTTELREKLKPHLGELFRINGFHPAEMKNANNFAAVNLLNRINMRLVEINQKFRATLTKQDALAFEELVIHFGIFTDPDTRKDSFPDELKEYFNCHTLLLEAGNKLARKSQVIDYTDMVYLPYEWQLYPAKKYEFLFIDECQDLSRAQFATAVKYGKKNGRILAVGDPQQSIYGFTGADIESFHRVQKYTQAIRLPLTTCFRCPKNVIALAKTIRKDMLGNKDLDGTVKTIFFEDIADLVRPGDLVISRLRVPIVLLLFSFIDKNIRVNIHEDEVKEIINEIKNIFRQNELHLIIQNLTGGFEALKLEVTKRWHWIIDRNAARINDPTERRIYIHTEKKYLRNKLEFLHKKSLQWTDCRNLSDILLRIKNYISNVRDAVQLSTIHRAKGLENDRVFILNYDELPYKRPHQKDWERVQELNLKYVAVTRSLNELYLVENKKTERLKEEQSLFDELPLG